MPASTMMQWRLHSSGADATSSPRKRTATEDCSSSTGSEDPILHDHSRHDEEGSHASSCASREREEEERVVRSSSSVVLEEFVEGLPIAEARAELPDYLLAEGEEAFSKEVREEDLPVVASAVRVATGLRGTGRPASCSATVVKSKGADRLGLMLGSGPDGALLAAAVDRDGPLGASSIRPGDAIASIGGECCRAWTPADATARLRRLMGRVTVVAEHAAGDSSYARAAFPLTANGHPPVTFVDDGEDGVVRIASIDARGPLGRGGSALAVGDVVHRVCGALRPSTAREAEAALLLGGGGYFSGSDLAIVDVVKEVKAPLPKAQGETVSAQFYCSVAEEDCDENDCGSGKGFEEIAATESLDESETRRRTTTRPGIVSVAAPAFPQGSDLGVTFAKHGDGSGYPVVASLAPGGGMLSAFPSIRRGMRLLSIDGADCHRRDGAWAVQRLRAVPEGSVAQLALLDPAGDARYSLAAAAQRVPGGPAGVKFASCSSPHNLRLVGVNAGGIFAGSALCEGDVVAAINGVPSEFLLARQAAGVVRDTPPGTPVTMLTRRSPDTGAVVSCRDRSSWKWM